MSYALTLNRNLFSKGGFTYVWSIYNQRQC